MTDLKPIAVEVACATPERQKILSLQVAAGTSARQLVLASGLNEYFVEVDLQHCPIGVFGREVSDDYRVRAGDRVEIYRPLINEPREARRAAAARGETLGRT